MLSSVLALLLVLAPADSMATPPDTAVALLVQAVHSYVEPFSTPADDLHLRMDWADLSGDGVDDAVVYLDSPSWCGSGGCTVLVFETITGADAIAELGAFRPAAEINLMHGPVTVATTSHGGWADLIVEQADGQRVALHFDGETYPMSPAEGVAVGPTVAGNVLFATAD